MYCYLHFLKKFHYKIYLQLPYDFTAVIWLEHNKTALYYMIMLAVHTSHINDTHLILLRSGSSVSACPNISIVPMKNESSGGVMRIMLISLMDL